ncbi:hypothetical protein I4U23_003945 [Adineta vaga]|nr:hypothetical protein I4U23_003945 [Adineta vaga]
MLTLIWPIFFLSIRVESHFNFYITNHLQHDCLRFYSIRLNTLIKTEYCLRPTDHTHLITTDYFNTQEHNFTFHQLHQMNVTAYQLFIWSASIDLAEQYQHHIQQHNQSLQPNQLFYNCTQPWFGSRCQYSFQIDQLQPSIELKLNLPATNSTCYALLECDRGGSYLCLDWREICDGRIDCLNDGGIDEVHCFDLEINECQPNEYRCHNGLCIPEYYRTAEQITGACLDQSDAFNTLPCPTHGSPSSLFHCEENTCPPGRNTFSCGDGQCVEDYEQCDNGRHLMLFKSLIVQGNLSHNCWLALICLTRISHQIHETQCVEFFHSLDAIHHLHTCDDLIHFPITPVLYGHVHFLYRPKDVLEISISSALAPDYICYDERLCDYLSPTFRFESHACRHAHEMGFTMNAEYLSWKAIIDTVKPYFYGCNARYTDQYDPKHVSLYRCKNTSKYISKHRIVDNIVDCHLEDDERDFELSCSLDDPYRFGCSNRPLSAHTEGKNSDNILFNQICNGMIDLTPQSIDGRLQTDETKCDYWPCNTIYTRCNGVWDCPNGEDEENCRSSNCSHRHHLECTSPLNHTKICLSANQVRNGIVDCLGGLDEFHLCQTVNFYGGISYNFRCFDEAKCIDSSMICNGNDEISDVELCNEWTHYNLTELKSILCRISTLERVAFTLETSQIYPIIENQIMNRIPHLPSRLRNDGDEIIFPFKNVIASSPCTRGSSLYLRLGNTSYTSICMCPPNYYGNMCQYQNQRVSLTLTFLAINKHHIYAIFIKLIDDDDNHHRQEIQSYEQIIYVSKTTCGQPFDRYLLYSTRPKNLSRNYTIHIDVYDKISLEYISSWYFKVAFSFLPVNRLAVVLTLGTNRAVQSSSCSLPCEHGVCMKYMNEEKYFCECRRGWSGAECHIPIDCNDCSSDSKCVGNVKNRSICICPLGKFGSRCLLEHSCPVNYCRNGGQCVVTEK